MQSSGIIMEISVLCELDVAGTRWAALALSAVIEMS